MHDLPGAFHLDDTARTSQELTYPAFAILHQFGRFSGPPQKRVCEAMREIAAVVVER